MRNPTPTPTSSPRIDAEQRGLIHSELTGKVIGVFYDVYNELGHGFLESGYEQAMSVALVDQRIFFQRQFGIPVWFRGHQVGDFRADLLIEGKLILERKVGRAVEVAWEKQLLNYLRATEIEVGLTLNFGPTPQFRRLVFENEKKKIRVHPRESAENEVHPVADGEGLK